MKTSKVAKLARVTSLLKYAAVGAWVASITLLAAVFTPVHAEEPAMRVAMNTSAVTPAAAISFPKAAAEESVESFVERKSREMRAELNEQLAGKVNAQLQGHYMALQGGSAH